MPLGFGKPDVTVETDKQNRGTPYRTCSVAVYRDDLDTRQMDRVRAALSKIVSSPEVSVLTTGRESAGGRREFVRLRMVYYGERLSPASIVEAVQSAL